VQERDIAPLRCVVCSSFSRCEREIAARKKSPSSKGVTANSGNLNLAAFAADAHVPRSIGEIRHIAFLELDIHIRTGVVNLDVAILRSGGE